MEQNIFLVIRDAATSGLASSSVGREVVLHIVLISDVRGIFIVFGMMMSTSLATTAMTTMTETSPL